MDSLQLQKLDSGFQSSFSAVLQEIFAQTQIEIQETQARSQHSTPRGQGLSPQFTSPLDRLDWQLINSSHDTSYQCEQSRDPTLSYISGILADDDDPSTRHACLRLNELIAYQAKVTEVAALLQEDSPTLALQIEPQSPDSGASGESHPGTLSFYADKPSFWVETEPDMNELLLNSLQGPMRKGGNNGRMPMTVVRDDVGMRWNPYKPLRPCKIEKVKARREKGASRRQNGSKNRLARDGDREFVDMNDLLQQCSQAVGVNNTRRAIEIVNKVRQHASPYGNGAQRLAYYFAEAMDARFAGTGWPLYLGLLRRRPSPAEVLRAIHTYMASCPFVQAYHYFITHTILSVASRASKLCIVDLQITGFQYPSLFQALADRPGGPPQVHLIGIGFPHYAMLPAGMEAVLEGVQQTGRQLSECAAACGVPFKFTAWAGTREELCMQDLVPLHRDDDEVLVFISACMLRYVMDDSLDSPIVRSKLLKQGNDIHPDVYIQGIVTGSYSTPFFTRRFKEVLFHFESVFDMLDTFMDRESQDRTVFESEVLGRAIMNVVACEGAEVVERIDKYKQWQVVTEEAGFAQQPLDEEMKANMQVMLKSWHKEYTISEDSQYMVMGWKGRMLHALSTWRSSVGKPIEEAVLLPFE